MNLRGLPGVDTLLQSPELSPLLDLYGRSLVLHCIRHILGNYRRQLTKEDINYSLDDIINSISEYTRKIGEISLKPVYNLNGILLHTNLGRAPFGQAVIDDIGNLLRGYVNVEFDLEKAHRGKRGDHTEELLRYLTGTDGAVVVNNNAAGIILALSTFAKGKEVIVSRGELIEIGGSFRIPEIMKSAGVNMVEVGTTNRTRIEDYEEAITEDTAMLFKAHKSNYTIKGFTEEASIEQLVSLGRKHKIPFVYDIGSGLLRKPRALMEIFRNEPEVHQAAKMGCDMITFSGDKLLGGPQAGIIVGKGKYIKELKKAPLMRALRVGKMTLAALCSVLMAYTSPDKLYSHNMVFRFLDRRAEELRSLAAKLQLELKKYNIESKIVSNTAYCGGGTLPETEIPSFALKISSGSIINDSGKSAEEYLYRKLLEIPKPVLGILRKGKLYFDVFTLLDEDLEAVAEIIGKTAGGAIDEE